MALNTVVYGNNITKNITATSNSLRQVDEKVLIVQVLVGIFLYVNFTLLVTFFKKEAFRTNTRYIFFAHTLFCDSLFLFMSDFLLLLSFFRIPMPVGLCVVFCVLVMLLTFATPLTLTAMSVERYVAICMPLRHAEISTPQRAMLCVCLIHVISAAYPLVQLFIFVASVSLNFYSSLNICSVVEMFIVQKWQGNLRSAVAQFYFLVMSSSIIFTYIKIMQAAKLASADKKSNTSKGLKTVILHGVQLFLCLIQLWTPYIESVVLEISLSVFIDVRYFNYIAFVLAPRCLSPLIYGLRDEDFSIVMKYYIVCGLNKKISPFRVN